MAAARSKMSHFRIDHCRRLLPRTFVFPRGLRMPLMSRCPKQATCWPHEHKWYCQTNGGARKICIYQRTDWLSRKGMDKSMATSSQSCAVMICVVRRTSNQDTSWSIKLLKVASHSYTLVACFIRSTAVPNPKCSRVVVWPTNPVEKNDTQAKGRKLVPWKMFLSYRLRQVPILFLAGTESFRWWIFCIVTSSIGRIIQHFNHICEHKLNVPKNRNHIQSK